MFLFICVKESVKLPSPIGKLNRKVTTLRGTCTFCACAFVTNALWLSKNKMVLLYLSAEQRTFRGSVVIDDFDLTTCHPFLYESSHLSDIKILILGKCLYGLVKTVTQVFE